MSYITLYASKYLQQGKNFLIEDFSSYLATLTGTTSIDKFQYIRPLKTIIIKIDTDQINATPFPASKYNYLSLKVNGSGDLHPYYYFITHKVQKAASTVEFTCEMDVLNTFGWNSDYKVNKKTLVTREHKDRFSRHQNNWKTIELGDTPTAIAIDNYYAVDVAHFFLMNETFTVKGNLEVYTLNGELVASVNTATMGPAYDSRMKSSISGVNPFISFMVYNNVTQTEGDTRFNMYNENYYVIIKANSTNKSTLEGFMAYLFDVETFSDGTVYLRNIHMNSEGINPVLYKTYESTIYDQIDTTYVLYYKNKNAIDPDAYNEDNPVECYLTTKDDLLVNIPSALVGTVYPSDFADAYNVIADSGTFEIDNETVTLSFKQTFWNITAYRLDIFISGGAFARIRLYKVTGQRAYIPGVIDQWTYTSRVVREWTSLASISIGTNGQTIGYYTSSSQINIIYPSVNGVYTKLDVTTTLTSYYCSIDKLDRTLAENIKIIDLPYAPCNIQQTSGGIILPIDWNYKPAMEMFLLNDLNTVFYNKFNTEWNPLDPLIFEITIDSSTPNGTRNDLFESKIYHSDYYKPKFVYDSFSKQFMLEYVDVGVYNQALHENFNEFNITFIPSTNIVSKFLFMFELYTTKYSTEDYDNVCAISRNNEEVLYNSQYINYLRTGYNYDLKAKERTEVAGNAALIASILGTGVGVVGGLLGGNLAMTGLGAVVGMASIASSSVSYAKSIADNEQNIARKLEESQRQAISVQNADDLDLLNAYTSGNKAKWCLYETSPIMKQALLDMFYYSGYSTMERKIPTINTRYWFNYLQCELATEQSTSAYMSDEIMQDLKERFKEGVTFFHHHTTWDLEQVKENLEVSLLS